MESVGHRGILPEPLSDEEQDVLREVALAHKPLPQDLADASGLEHEPPKSASFASMPPSETPRSRTRNPETDAAPHHPERKLS